MIAVCLLLYFEGPHCWKDNVHEANTHKLFKICLNDMVVKVVRNAEQWVCEIYVVICLKLNYGKIIQNC